MLTLAKHVHIDSTPVLLSASQYYSNLINENNIVTLFLGQFRIFENLPLDPVWSLRGISEKKQIWEKQKFEKNV